MIPVEIIEAFHGLNTIISTTHELSNLSEFKELSNFLLTMLTIEPFSQKQLIPTVHRALCHFEAYYRHFEFLQLPFGSLSESALEARNKYTHRFRENLCFKGTLKKNLRDLGIRRSFDFFKHKTNRKQKVCLNFIILSYSYKYYGCVDRYNIYYNMCKDI